ncbi:MAG: hypothetical protein R3218_02830, partial [Christiangramia sp.]|nr:hypothetical protein [Christiangramia sp.]
MVSVSIFLVLSPKFRESGKLWYGDILTGRSYEPKFAKPEWFNIFTKEDFPPTMVFDSQDDAIH